MMLLSSGLFSQLSIDEPIKGKKATRSLARIAFLIATPFPLAPL